MSKRNNCLRWAFLLLLGVACAGLSYAAAAPEAPLPVSTVPPASGQEPSFASTNPPLVDTEELGSPPSAEAGTSAAEVVAAAEETLDNSPAAEKLRAANALNDDEGTPPGRMTPAEEVPPSTAHSALKSFGALLIVLALIFFLSWGMRRFGKRSPLFAHVHLGQVLGRLYLDRSSCLYYVRTGGRILAIGSTRNGLALVAEFDESAFDLKSAASESQLAPKLRFSDYLKAGTQNLSRSSDRVPIDDRDIATLRGDIRRLQEQLREASGEHKE